MDDLIGCWHPFLYNGVVVWINGMPMDLEATVAVDAATGRLVLVDPSRLTLHSKVLEHLNGYLDGSDTGI